MSLSFCKHCGGKLSDEQVKYAALYCSIRCRDKFRRAAIRDEFIKEYGGGCQCPGCGVTQPEFLTLDHIFNDGFRDRTKVRRRSGYLMYRELKRQGWPKDRFQLLCWNCNSAKAYFGGCPHEKLLTSK